MVQEKEERIFITPDSADGRITVKASTRNLEMSS